MMRVVVTGASGFTGSMLVRHLSAAGHEVIATTRRSSDAAGAARTVRGDLRDPATLAATGGVDAVCHTAAAIVLSGSAAEQQAAFDENVAATYAVVRWCEATGVTRLIYSSSASVYARGDGSAPLDEETPFGPATPYAAGKLAGEWLASSRHLRVRGTILRYSSVYGEGQRAGSVLPRFIAAVRGGGGVAVHGSGIRSQDFVHVRDVCEANRLALEAGTAAGEVFNIGSGEEISMAALAEAVVCEFGGEVRQVEVENEDVSRVRLDVTKARRLLGYAPRTLREGLRTYSE
jgi:UDP-glucose 4-epimerase